MLFAAVGCGPTTEADTGVSAKPVASLYPTKAQRKLATVKLLLGREEIVAEIARTEMQITTGMMFRESMEENEGMIFVFPYASQRAFWMKNTKLPLSVAYIDSEGRILEIHDLEPFNEESVPSRNAEVRFVLEMNQGWFERHGIKVGALMRTEHGSLMETFFGGMLPATR